MKKMTIVVESSSSFDIEVSLPPLEEKLYTMLEAAPQMTSSLFASRKPNGRFIIQLCLS